MRDLWTLPATKLAALIAAGDVSSVEAVRAHIARIEAVDGLLNAVVVRRFEAALAEAGAADERLARGELSGALHGVPVSIKESQDVAGTPSTFGLPTRASDVALRDEPYVARLRGAGAIVLAKTNVPQLLIFIETDNPLYGRTNNPWNVARTCGGSSGGEAALIAAGGSPLGLGSDLGGSLRTPAAFCGIVSLKPTTGRLDDTTRLSNFAGQRAIVSQEGPLARTVGDVALAYGILTGDDTGGVRNDGGAALGFEAPNLRELRVGYYERAGSFAPAPALARAVREAAALLAERGATVVPFEPPHVDEAMDLFFGILSADGGRGARNVVGANPRDVRVNDLFGIVSKPRPFVAAVEALLGATGQRGLRRIVRNYGRTQTHHYWKLVEGVAAYRTLFAHAMDASDAGALDIILCPPVGLPALPHGQSANVVTAGAYGPLYNVLGYPCGTLPLTRVRAREQVGRRPSQDRMEQAAYESERGSAGLPVGVQVVARPWREEAALAVMRVLEHAARESPDFPVSPRDPLPPAPTPLV